MYLLTECNLIKTRYRDRSFAIVKIKDTVYSELMDLLLRRKHFDGISDGTYSYPFFDFYFNNINTELPCFSAQHQFHSFKNLIDAIREFINCSL